MTNNRWELPSGAVFTYDCPNYSLVSADGSHKAMSTSECSTVKDAVEAVRRQTHNWLPESDLHTLVLIGAGMGTVEQKKSRLPLLLVCAVVAVAFCVLWLKGI